MAEVTAKKQKSYFTKSINRYYLDDEESFIEHKPLDEGLFQEYQDLTSKIKLDRLGENTELDIRPGVQRRFLLENLVVGWNMLDEGKPVSFTPRTLAQLPPDIIQGLIDDIYEKNSVLRRGGDDEDSEGKQKPK